MKNPLQNLKTLNGWTKGRPFSFSTSPENDWKIIFFSTTVIIILVIVLSIFIFIKINEGEIFIVEKQVEPVEKRLDVSLLKNTVSYYKNKALEFERIKSLVVPSVDPSL